MPYDFKTISNLSDFSVFFNTKESDWTLEHINSVVIVFAKAKPENWSSVVNKTFCICSNLRDV